MSYSDLLVHHGSVYRQGVTYEEGTPVGGTWGEVSSFLCRLSPSSAQEAFSTRSDQRGYDERATLFLDYAVELRRTDRIRVDEFPDDLWEVIGIIDRWEHSAPHHFEVQLGRVTGT